MGRIDDVSSWRADPFFTAFSAVLFPDRGQTAVWWPGRFSGGCASTEIEHTELPGGGDNTFLPDSCLILWRSKKINAAASVPK
jgi:hypothetical protein